MQTYLSYSPWIQDCALVPLPWRSVTPPPKLKIAVMWSDDIVTPHPPITRAIKEICADLSLHPDQFELVEWKPVGHDICWNTTQALYFEDGGRGLVKEIEDAGETVLPLTRWLLEDGGNVKYRTVEDVCAVSDLVSTKDAISSSSPVVYTKADDVVPQLKVQRNTYRDQYNELWNATGAEDGHTVDAILCPTGPGAAPPHGNAKYWSYTSQWNLLEYAAAVFPVTTVDPKLDIKPMDYTPKNEKDKFNWDLYNPETYVNAPVGLQIVTRKWEDEKCLAVVKAIEQTMGRQ